MVVPQTSTSPHQHSNHNGIVFIQRWRQGGQQTLSHVRKTWGTLGLSLPGYVCELIKHTDWDRIVTGDAYEVLSNWKEKMYEEEYIPGNCSPVHPMRETCLYKWCKMLKSSVGNHEAFMQFVLHGTTATSDNCNAWILETNNGFNMNGFDTWSDHIFYRVCLEPLASYTKINVDASQIRATGNGLRAFSTSDLPTQLATYST